MEKNEKGHYPNKAYKVHPFYNEVFNASLSLYERDKFTEYLIKHYFKYEQITKLPRYNKADLFENMINDLEKSNKDISSLIHCFESKRITELNKMYKVYDGDPEGLNWRKVFNVRISSDTKKQIEELSKKTETLAEVIELAIAYFICNCNETLYELIKFAFEYSIENSD